MKFVLIIICLILSIWVVSAFEFSEGVKGKGELDARANIKGGQEAVRGFGDNKYVIYIEDHKNAPLTNSRLDSVYELDNVSTVVTGLPQMKSSFKVGNEPWISTSGENYYKISMNRPGGMQQMAKMRSNGAMISDSNLTYSALGASTNFILYSQGGTIDEQVTTQDNDKNRWNTVIETHTTGLMGISSHLVDDKILNDSLSEAQFQSSNLESVKLFGEIARREIFANTTDFIFTSPSGKAVTVNVEPGFIAGSIKGLGIKGLAPADKYINGDGTISKNSGSFLHNDPPLRIMQSGDGENVSVSGANESNSNGSKVLLETGNDVYVGGGGDIYNSGGDIFFNEAIKAAEKSSKKSTELSRILETAETGINNSTEVAASRILGTSGNEVYAGSGGNILGNAFIRGKFNITKPVEDIAYFRLGRVLQRLHKVAVGRAVRRDGYFSEKMVPIPKNVSRNANVACSMVNGTIRM